MRTFAILVAYLFFTVPCQARIVYVDANTPDNSDGSSWAKAYKYLQNALADANSSGDVNEIRVAKGIYKPDQSSADPNGSRDRDATFQLVNDVALNGGYAGFGEPDPNARDLQLYETILSGDLNGDDIEVSNPADDPNRVENSYHVVTGSGVNETAVLYGFTVIAGNAYAYSFPDDCGGGMLNYYGSPSIKSCTFRGNRAKWIPGWWMHHGGGAMYNYFSRAKIHNCVFVGNKADNGGGMLNCYSPVQVSSCTFSSNLGSSGGALYSSSTNNSSYASMFTNCIFTRNYASVDSGVYCYVDNITFNNCVFYYNSRGICVNGAFSESNCILKNCILWGDIDTEIWIVNPPAIVTISYSNIEGGQSGVLYSEGSTLNWGEGNIDVDPCFADTNNGDFHIKSEAGRWNPVKQRWVYDEVTSSCIDAGDPNSSVGLEPNPNGNRINMGAYGGTAEASKSYCANPIDGDINGDCKVDFKDFAIMASHWLEDNRS
jgi:hypothetical protein